MPVNRLSIVVLAAALGGCGYAGDRLNDARDILHIDFSLGPQLGATARVTHIFQAGVSTEGTVIGREEEDWFYDASHIAWNGRWAGIHKRIGHEAGIGPETIEPKWYRRQYTAEYEEEYKDQKRTPDEIGASVAAGIVGGELGVRPAEFFDFLLGWFGQDIMKDDGQRAGHEDKERWVDSGDSCCGGECEDSWHPSRRK